jgi:nucleoporin NUP159
MSIGGDKGGASGFAALGSGDKDKPPTSIFGEKKPTPSLFGEKKPSLPADPSGSTVSFGNNTSFGSGSTTFGVRSGFGSPDNASTFGKPSVPASREESMDDDGATSDTTSTAKPPTVTSKSPFDLGSGGFQLGSTFKGDGTAKDDLPKSKDPGAGLFGTGFLDSIGDTSKTSGASEGAAWLSGGSTPSSAAVKKEPDSEDDAPKLKDIPPAAPPKKEEEKSAPVDDAPLPPDPATWKPKPGALPAPVPPGFGADFGKAKETKETAPVDAPLPPDFASPKKGGKGADEVPVAGSPPVDLGDEKFSEGVPSDAEGHGPPEDEEDWSDEEGEGEDEEEDDQNGEEEEDEESADEHGTPEITDPKGLSAFESRLTPASPKRGEAKTLGQDQSTTPATDKKESYTPAGLPPAPVMFPPPQRKGPQSPRSPSPVRSATSPLRPLPNFGSSQPIAATHPSQSGLRLPSSPRPFAQSQQPASRSTSQAQPPQRIAVPPAQLLPKQPPKPAAPTKPSEPDAGSLEDEEDARIQSILSAPIEPTKDVPAFLAHQDYVANGGEKSGLGGQIERVFRDINSMIDTLALNARSLQGFVAGNMRPNGAEEKGRFDLEDEESWVIGEASELSRVVDGVEIELEDGKLDDVRGALESLKEEERELAKLRAKSADARKRIQAKRDPEQLSQQANAALPVETQTLQAELRQGTQKVQTLMSKAEELLSVLRAELASQPQSKGKGGQGVNGAGMPSVEAVEKTILKMTRMIEERSGDVDVLEANIRKLNPDALKVLKRQNAIDGGVVDDLAASLKATQISKSTSGAAALRASRVSAYGSPVAGRRSRREGTPGTADSLAWKGSLMDVSNEDIEAYRLKKDARRRAMDRLRETLESKGPRVVRVGEA